MTKYIEVGTGNRYFVRTEFESSDGYEWEVKGIVEPLNYQSVYCRLWIWNRVFIVDSREGIKCLVKPKHRFKFVLGMVCPVD